MTQATFDTSKTASQRVVNAIEGAATPAVQHVFTQLYADAARATAQQCDAEAQAGRRLGALHGVCITLKDNIDLAGETTMAGGVVCADEAPAQHDAPVLKRLRQAGAVVTRASSQHQVDGTASSCIIILVSSSQPRKSSKLMACSRTAVLSLTSFSRLVVPGSRSDSHDSDGADVKRPKTSA